MTPDRAARHDVLRHAALIFATNVVGCAAAGEQALHAAWLFVLLTSVYHHHRPTALGWTIADQIAVYYLVGQNAYASLFCPAWVRAFFGWTVAYSGTWYYAAKLGWIRRGHLVLHVVMYGLTSVSGNAIVWMR